MDTKTILFPNLMAEMARNGFTITSLADCVGKTRANLSAKLIGKTALTIADAIEIRDAINRNSAGGMTLDYLFAKGA